MSEDTAKKVDPRDIFERMAENPAIKTLRKKGKVLIQVLPQSRTGSLPFRKGATVYGTLAAIRQCSGCFRFHNSKEKLDMTFTTQVLLRTLQAGQTDCIFLLFEKAAKVSIKKSDLQKLLTDTGAI